VIPQFTQGVFSQQLWRGVGDVDDCAVLADITCAHACAPWSSLPSATAYRSAAGNPDDPSAADGLSQAQSVQAIRALWPKIGAKLTVSAGTGTWAAYLAAVKSGRCASSSVFSAAIATKDGVAVRHRVSIYWNGSLLRIVNPLRKAHSIGEEITEATLKKAMDDYPDAGLWYILFPTVEEAFTTHPLYIAPGGFTQAQLDAAVATNEAKWDTWVTTHP